MKGKQLHRVLIAVLLFSITTTSTTQAQTKRSFGLGVRAGLNVADYTNSRGEHMTGWVAGAYTDLYFTEHLALEIGGYYSRQGCENIYTPETYSGRIDNQLDYGQLQFGLKYNVIGGFRVQAMMETDFLLSAKTTLRPSGATSTSQYTILNDPYNANKITLNISAGVGYRFKFGLDLMASYNGGITPIYEYSDHYTSMFRITLGWRIIGAKLKDQKK
ncbi:MAG: porin family protein [Rikenellaceae bacterium]